MDYGVELGDLVECKITGFKGIATMRVFHLNKCTQIAVQPRMKAKDVDVPKKEVIDEQDLIVIKAAKPKVEPKKRTGGAHLDRALVDKL